MAIPRSKVELVLAIDDGYGKLSADLARVPAAHVREASLPGHKAGTMMSPSDLVSYLIGWAELVRWWHEQRLDGIEPDFPAPGFGWNQLGELAQKFYADYADLSWPELLVRFAAAKDRVVALVDGLTDEDLYGSAWYGKYTAGRMIQFNTSSPYVNARRRLRAWLRDNGL